MNLDRKELDDSLDYLTLDQQVSILSTLKLINSSEDTEHLQERIKTVIDIMVAQTPLRNFCKFSYNSQESVRDLKNAIQYVSYPKNTTIFHSKNPQSENYIFILILGKVMYCKNNDTYSLPKLMSKMDKYDLKKVFIDITGLNFDLKAIPSEKIEEFELLDSLVEHLKQFYMESDYYDLLNLNDFRKTSRVFYNKPGDCFGIEEILKFPKKNSEETTLRTLTQTHLLAIDKLSFMSIIGKNYIKAINDRQLFVVGVCPFIQQSNYSSLILRRIRYIYPIKGEVIYFEKQRADFLYLILKGSGILKKTLYIDINKNFSITRSKFVSNFNYVIPSRSRTVNFIGLGVGSFAGSEILFEKNPEYKYTFETTDNNTLLCQFDFQDFYHCDLIKEFKKYLKQTYENHEKHFDKKLSILNVKNMSIDYRNLMKNQFLKMRTPLNVVPSSVNKIKIKDTTVNCKMIRKPVINLSGRATNKAICKPRFESPRFDIHNSSVNQFFDNDKISAFMTGLNHHTSKSLFKQRTFKDILFLNKSEKPIEIQKEAEIKIKPQKNLINFLKSETFTEFDSQLYLSLNNWLKNKHNYTTKSFKIPLVSMLKKTMKKSPTTIDYNHCQIP